MLDQKARDVGRLIGQSTEYQSLRRANEALNADSGAVKLLRRMEELRVTAQQMIERGESPGADMETELDELLSRVQVNTTYQQALAAQENFDKLMLRVNGWITEGIKAGSASPIITLG